MRATPKQYAKTLLEITKELKNKEEIKIIINNFLKILKKNNQITKTEKIINHFNLIWRRKYGISKVEIISSRDLDKDIFNDLKKYLKNKTGNDNIVVKNIIDKEIKGGFIIKIGDLIFDSSLKTRINEFKKHFN